MSTSALTVCGLILVAIQLIISGFIPLLHTGQVEGNSTETFFPILLIVIVSINISHPFAWAPATGAFFSVYVRVGRCKGSYFQRGSNYCLHCRPDHSDGVIAHEFRSTVYTHGHIHGHWQMVRQLMMLEASLIMLVIFFSSFYLVSFS